MATKIQVKRGDTWRMAFACVDDDGTATDLTGVTAAMQLRVSADDETLADWDSTSELTVDVVDSEIVLEVAAADTEDFEPGTYLADLEMTFPDGTVTSTETFKVEVLADITRAEETVP